MDKQQRASNLVKLLYEYRTNKTNNESRLIKAVCEYFDDVKNTELTNGDRFFLRYMASVVGIPQYFDMLKHYNRRIKDFNDYGNIDDLGRIIADGSLYTAPEIYLHRYQKSILDMFQKNRQNRFFLSATTSFGKTYLVYEIIRKMEYGNILLVFPTLALLSENINKIFTEKYAWIRNQYKIHTLSDTSSWSDHGNLMIYTPERYLSFLDKNPDKHFDFVFIDEAYKIDNDYLQEGEEKENERDVAYRIASYFAMKDVNIDCLFAGPYLNIDNSEKSSSFSLFLHEYGITPLNYNDYEIVSKIEISIGQKKSLVTDGLNITLKSTKKGERFCELVQQLCNYGENMIAYCYSRSSVEKYAYELIRSMEPDKDVQQHMSLLKHLDNLFGGRGKEWIVTKAIKAGIGVHHGLVPKYIQNEIIKLFNEGILKIIIATTTITEGVNTSAKNIIVLSHKKGSKMLKKFDAQNIEGRAGRFLKHYRGRVFIIDNEFNRILQGDDNSIKHKHFDKEIEKGAIEVDFVKNQFLNAEDVRQKEKNTAIREGIQIPEQLDLCYKTISIDDKYFLYSRIGRLSQNYLSCIKQFISQYNSRRRCNTEGLQLICDIIRPIIKNNDLGFLIDNKSNDANVSTLTRLIPLYLKNNFSASVHYYITERGNNVDDAVQKVAQTSYNTMRYQVVKYLGLFNVAYKCFIAQRDDVEFDDVSGIDLILHKLEYQSETIIGRLASDAGASPNVINYYDQRGKDYNRAVVLYDRLDDYEKQNAEAIRHIVERDFD